MHELRMSQSPARPQTTSAGEESIPVPQRELLAFIETASNLIGAVNRSFLTEIWLDQLASMDRMPEPSSPNWRLVTLAAFRALAMHLIDMQIHYPACWRSIDVNAPR
jgi:hypothetical protein